LATGPVPYRSASRIAHLPDSLHRTLCRKRWASDPRASHSSDERQDRQPPRRGPARSPVAPSTLPAAAPDGPCAAPAASRTARAAARRYYLTRYATLTSPSGHRRDAFATSWAHLRRIARHPLPRADLSGDCLTCGGIPAASLISVAGPLDH